jgi:uncharacterized protein YbjT (DUF2867 family)
MPDKALILVTGATGYVGGRLVPRLLEAGHQVRVLVRDAARLHGRSWHSQVEVVEGDVLLPETLPSALSGVSTAYYLVHSMGRFDDFYGRDLIAAYNFGQAARQARLSRIIYLGGLGDAQTVLSEHLRSRHRTGDALRDSGVPVTEFQAAVIVGSGSASFEMIRYLAERMPIFPCPRWAQNRVQPISIRHVLEYLIAALETPQSAGQIIEIGGADTLTYRDMVLGYAHVRGLHRLSIDLPILPPGLCAHMVHWLTPVPLKIARPLIHSLYNEAVVQGDTARRLFPAISPFDYETSVRRALMRIEIGEVETSWHDALISSRGDIPPFVLTTHEGLIIEQRQMTVKASPEDVFRIFTGLGGDRGWLVFNWAWRLRGEIDRLLGGAGLRRGRRHPDSVRVGDALDYWRVEAVRSGHSLRLMAEMRMPGRAWLEFKAEAVDAQHTCLTQLALFAPKGVGGLVYWYLLYPIHTLIFSGLIRAVACRAEALHLSSLASA